MLEAPTPVYSQLFFLLLREHFLYIDRDFFLVVIYCCYIIAIKVAKRLLAALNCRIIVAICLAIAAQNSWGSRVESFRHEFGFDNFLCCICGSPSWCKLQVAWNAQWDGYMGEKSIKSDYCKTRIGDSGIFFFKIDYLMHLLAHLKYFTMHWKYIKNNSKPSHLSMKKLRLK
jgi:hypothetical protein